MPKLITKLIHKLQAAGEAQPAPGKGEADPPLEKDQETVPLAYRTWVPPGHFYSPIVDLEELQRRRSTVFDRSMPPKGIDLNEEVQLEFLERLAQHVPELPFREKEQDGQRYFYLNPNFSFGDAIILSTLLMELKPKRIIEIGSGYSSCAILDIREKFLSPNTNVTFVEPYPDLFYSLIKPEDKANCTILPIQVQDLDLKIIDELEAGDVLFIDSSHVSKAGSDVNFELFEILPRLKSGVYIHFHDIFYPFEYPEEWFFTENRSWNELYLMRAFLMYNDKFEIVFFNHFMMSKHGERIMKSIPLMAQNCGGSLWLRKR